MYLDHSIDANIHSPPHPHPHTHTHTVTKQSLYPHRRTTSSACI